MRAVVTQIQGKFAAILSEDGRIEKITNKNYVICLLYTSRCV